MRSAKEWKVYIQICPATPPTSIFKRSLISFAALFVNVTAKILKGGTPS